MSQSSDTCWLSNPSDCKTTYRSKQLWTNTSHQIKHYFPWNHLSTDQSPSIWNQTAMSMVPHSTEPLWGCLLHRLNGNKNLSFRIWKRSLQMCSWPIGWQNQSIFGHSGTLWWPGNSKILWTDQLPSEISYLTFARRFRGPLYGFSWP